MNNPKTPADTSGQHSASPSGSAWEKINAIFHEADTIEELIQLRMERPGETRDSALEWAKEQVERVGLTVMGSIPRETGYSGYSG